MLFKCIRSYRTRKPDGKPVRVKSTLMLQWLESRTLPSTWVVDTLQDEADGQGGGDFRGSDGTLSLREAMYAVNYYGGGTIAISPSRGSSTSRMSCRR